MLGEVVDGRNPEPGELDVQLGERGDDPFRLSVSAQDEAHHQFSGRAGRHVQVLELAPTLRHVVGEQAQVVDEVSEYGQGAPDRPLMDATVLEVDAPLPCIENAERGIADATSHDQLGAIAKLRFSGHEGVQPSQLGHDVGEHATCRGALVAQLHAIRDPHEAAGAATTRVEVMTLHGQAPIVRGQATGKSGWSIGAPSGKTSRSSSNGGEVTHSRGACRASSAR